MKNLLLTGTRPFLFTITMLLVLGVTGCEIMADHLCDNIELSRVASPDQRLDAVLLKTACGGATTAYVYRIMLTPHGRKPTRSNTVLLAEKLKGESLAWLSPSVVEIRYSDAEVKDYKQLWQPKDEADQQIPVVEVRHERD